MSADFVILPRFTLATCAANVMRAGTKCFRVNQLGVDVGGDARSYAVHETRASLALAFFT